MLVLLSLKFENYLFFQLFLYTVPISKGYLNLVCSNELSIYIDCFERSVALDIVGVFSLRCSSKFLLILCGFVIFKNVFLHTIFFCHARFNQTQLCVSKQESFLLNINAGLNILVFCFKTAIQASKLSGELSILNYFAESNTNKANKLTTLNKIQLAFKWKLSEPRQFLNWLFEIFNVLVISTPFELNDTNKSDLGILMPC